MHSCVYASIMQSIMCIDWCDLHHDQGLFHHPFPHPSTPGNSCPVLRLYNCVRARVTYKSHQTVYNLSRSGFLLHIIPLRPIQVVMHIHSSFPFQYHGTEVPQFNHLPTEGHLGCFQFRIVTGKSAVNMCV